MHGLRHAYALARYEDLKGWKASAAGGPSRRSLPEAMRRADTTARLTVSRELGHGRLMSPRPTWGADGPDRAFYGASRPSCAAIARKTSS